MTRHYYAFFHTYGIHTMSAATSLPIGTIHRFGSERERDSWIAAERHESGSVHRESIDSKLARKLLEHMFMTAWDWDVAAVLGRDAPHERGFWRKAATTSQLWDICMRQN